VVETAVKPTVVSSKKHFTHEDVESILSDVQGAESDYLKSCVLVLFQIALMLRKQRKGRSSFLTRDVASLIFIF
jgi:exoribonuclease R